MDATCRNQTAFAWSSDGHHPVSTRSSRGIYAVITHQSHCIHLGRDSRRVDDTADDAGAEMGCGAQVVHVQAWAAACGGSGEVCFSFSASSSLLLRSMMIMIDHVVLGGGGDVVDDGGGGGGTYGDGAHRAARRTSDDPSRR